MNTTVVLKFGGTSVMAPEAIQRIVLTAAESHQVVLVVSALAGITNALTLGKNNVVKRLQEDWQAHHGTSVNVDDLPMEPASGEKASARLIAAYLEQHGIAATAIFADADKVVHSARGRISFVDPTAIESCLSRNVVPVVTGFVSRDEVSGQTACLDRGGSDVSAVAIAARLHCEATIFTDVDGIKDCDPRLVPHAQTIPLLSVAEAKEMAFAGASILHPYTLSFATKSIEVRSTFDGWDGACTTISPLRINVPSARDVQALAVLQDCCIVDITGYETGKSGVAAKVFATLEHINIHMIMQTCTETMISLVIERRCPCAGPTYGLHGGYQERRHRYGHWAEIAAPGWRGGSNLSDGRLDGSQRRMHFAGLVGTLVVLCRPAHRLKTGRDCLVRDVFGRRALVTRTPSASDT